MEGVYVVAAGSERAVAKELFEAPFAVVEAGEGGRGEAVEAALALEVIGELLAAAITVPFNISANPRANGVPPCQWGRGVVY